MHEVLRADDRRSFTGHARKLSADVDAGAPVSDLRQYRGPQYRGPIDPLSPHRSACSQSYATCIEIDETGRSAGRSSLTRG
jgi:hypothetical protein